MLKMMDMKNSLLMGALSAFALTSCVNENDDLYKVGQSMGTLELDVDILQPISRAITEVDNFPVYLYDAEGKLVQSWSTVPEVPEKITLSVGNYTVESHTPGEIAKQMSSPYYKGAKDVEILKGVTSGVQVVCRMENSPITVSYSDDFTDVFASWEQRGWFNQQHSPLLHQYFFRCSRLFVLWRERCQGTEGKLPWYYQGW